MGRIARNAARAALIMLLVPALAACSARYRNHGYVPDDELLSELVVGLDTRASVEETVGRPSTTGLLQDSAWYYIASQFRHSGLYAPEEVQRQLVAIVFDDEGTVSNIARFTLEDGQVVTLSRRVTDSGVGEITLIDQLLRNFGRLNASDFLGSSASSSPAPGGLPGQ